MVSVEVEARGERAQIGRISWSEGDFKAAISGLDDLTKKLQDAGDYYHFEPGEAIDFGGPDFS